MNHLFLLNFVTNNKHAATAMFANQEIVDYMNQHLMHYMSPMALLPSLQQQHLLTEEDVGEQ